MVVSEAGAASVSEVALRLVHGTAPSPAAAGVPEPRAAGAIWPGFAAAAFGFGATGFAAGLPGAGLAVAGLPEAGLAATGLGAGTKVVAGGALGSPGRFGGPTKTSTASAGPSGSEASEKLLLAGPRLDSMTGAESGSPLAATSGESSSVAGRLRCGPHISSRRLGGAALMGVSASTVPRDGVSQDSPLLLNPRSSSLAAFCARNGDEGAPRMTAIRRLPFLVALATRLNPEAQMKPVFMPSAPG